MELAVADEAQEGGPEDSDEAVNSDGVNVAHDGHFALGLYKIRKSRNSE